MEQLNVKDGELILHQKQIEQIKEQLQEKVSVSLPIEQADGKSM
jgi:hypothetical protein